MATMLANDAARAHVELVILTEVFGLFLGMLKAKLLCEGLIDTLGALNIILMLTEVV
jgi:hypothetical protein